MADNTSATVRDESLSKNLVDENYIVDLVLDTWTRGEVERETNLERRLAFENSWRQFQTEDLTGPWENSANFHIPLAFTFGKATHARLWQIFSAPQGFFKVESRNQAFQEKEDHVKRFMDFMLFEYANGGIGAKREFDKWLWDVVFQGSGYIKCYWKTDIREYREIVPVLEKTTTYSVDPTSLTGATSFETSISEEEQDIIEEVEFPEVRRVLWEDVQLPIGYTDPQDAPHVVTRVFMSDNDMKDYVTQKKFFTEAVESCLGDTTNIYLNHGVESGVKEARAETDGYDPLNGANNMHIILEYMGPAYVLKEMFNVDELDKDVTETKREIVAWVHKDKKRLLGWTYMNRVSPGGIRPLFKSDYVTIPDRADGVGVPELLYDIGRYMDASHNLKFDNGTIASIPMFAYRNSSTSLKSLTYRMKPGQGIPLDDINDIRPFNIPYLGSFGSQETQELNSIAEKMIALNELSMGALPSKVGALRNATGSNIIAQESSIQLEPHFDRIASCMNRFLQFFFRLCRERVKEGLYYRVTNDQGNPVFGTVSRADLKGDFDFKISVDLLGQSQIEKQQKAVLAMQTLINPVFLQTGIVTPENLYHLVENFIRSQRLGRVSDYCTPPQGYTGPKLTVNERLSRIIVNSFDNPPIEKTIRMDEDHEEAIRQLEAFKANEQLFGLLQTPGQLAALANLISEHNRMLIAQQAGGNPNISGMQVPRDGFGAVSPTLGGGGESLQTENVATPNGPVV